MGNFEKLSVLVIVVIIVMILVVALYTWQDTGDETGVNTGVNTGPALENGVPTGPAHEASLNPSPDPVEPFPLDIGNLFREGPEAIAVPGPESDAETESEPGSEAGTDPEAEPEGAPPGPDAGSEPAPGTDAPGANETWIYTIKNGDTISHIAERELGTIRRQKEIFQLNPGLDALKIRAGDQLKMPPRARASSTRGAGPAGTAIAAGTRGTSIPTGDYYVIQRGDRLQTIAKRAYGNMDRWPELWARNLSAIPSIDDDLTPGTKIFIPK